MLNGVGAHHLVAFTSMLALGEGAGLARDVLLDAFTTGAFATPSYVGKREKLLARDYTADFALELRAEGLRELLNLHSRRRWASSSPFHRADRPAVDWARGGLGQLDLFALEKHYGREDEESTQ